MTSGDRKPTSRDSTAVALPIEFVQRRILVIRDQRVMLDADLAELYGVTTGRLVEAVKRNIDRFPPDFMFQLNGDEQSALISQIAISNEEHPAHSGNLISQIAISSSWGGRRTPPYAFTEHGVAMLSSVLRSKRAVAVSIEIVRAFVLLRQVLATHAELAHKLDDLERRYDQQFRVVFDAIRQLMEPPPKPRRQIGFAPSDDSSDEPVAQSDRSSAGSEHPRSTDSVARPT